MDVVVIAIMAIIVILVVITIVIVVLTGVVGPNCNSDSGCNCYPQQFTSNFVGRYTECLPARN